MDKKIYNILNDYNDEINFLENGNFEIIDRAERVMEMLLLMSIRRINPVKQFVVPGGVLIQEMIFLLRSHFYTLTNSLIKHGSQF